jgi:hypothetical protein
MNYFTEYKKALKSKFHQSMIKYIQSVGLSRFFVSFIIFLTGVGIYLYSYVITPLTQGLERPNLTIMDYLISYGNVIAIGIILINTIAWAISEFKYNVIFVTQILLIITYLICFYADLFFNATVISSVLILISIIILLLPKQTRYRLYGLAPTHGGYFNNQKSRSSQSKSRHSSSRRSSRNHDKSSENSES